MDKFLHPFQKKKKILPATELKAVEAFINASIVPVQTGTKCVDGRYLPSQNSGMLARPGADGGYVMALEGVNRMRGLGLTPEQCFNAVFKAVTKLNGTFYLHTDHHVDPNDHTQHGLIGCGHMAKAGRRGFSWEYDIRSNDVKDIVNYARTLAEVSTKVKLVNLEGNHAEKGVIIVHSDKYTINSDNPKLQQMYFIYDVDRDRAFMKKLVETMGIKGVTYKDMIREADLQLEATLQNLAVGLPIFDVKFVGQKPQVTFAKQITQKPLFVRFHLPFVSLRKN